MHTPRSHPMALWVIASVALAGCSSIEARSANSSPSTASTTVMAPIMPAFSTSSGNKPAGAAPAATGSSSEVRPTDPVSSAPPDTIPPIPDGSYRLTLTQDDILAGGSDRLDNVGVWTMTISKGSYQVACKWIDDSGGDCGHDYNPDVVVEVGPVRGDDKRVWFASDLEAVSKKNGCTPLSECGNSDPYSFAWSMHGSDLVFSDTVGFGANVGDVYEPWTFKPWTRIA